MKSQVKKSLLRIFFVESDLRDAIAHAGPMETLVLLDALIKTLEVKEALVRIDAAMDEVDR